MITALIYAIVAIVVCIAIAAGILMLATKLVAGFAPKFPISAATAVVEFIAAAVVSWILHMVLGMGMLSSLVSLVIVFVVYAAIINAMIKQPAGGQMGFGKACLVTLVQIIIEIVLGVILVFVFGAAIFGILGGMH
ncbi:MAG: hypothetical protein ACREPN_09570 [Rudaea sp.]